MVIDAVSKPRHDAKETRVAATVVTAVRTRGVRAKANYGCYRGASRSFHVARLVSCGLGVLGSPSILTLYGTYLRAQSYCCRPHVSVAQINILQPPRRVCPHHVCPHHVCPLRWSASRSYFLSSASSALVAEGPSRPATLPSRPAPAGSSCWAASASTAEAGAAAAFSLDSAEVCAL
eukprot:scaffold3974_cov231-Pinguiococcus_pyrenoidosus.AAC.5